MLPSGLAEKGSTLRHVSLAGDVDENEHRGSCCLSQGNGDGDRRVRRGTVEVTRTLFRP
jgi:hypothetical protein